MRAETYKSAAIQSSDIESSNAGERRDDSVFIFCETSIYALDDELDLDDRFDRIWYNRTSAFCTTDARSSRLEGREPEGVATVLDPEDAQQERVHAEENGTPDEDSDLLLALVGHARHLQSETDGGEGEDAVWKTGSAVVFGLV